MTLSDIAKSFEAENPRQFVFYRNKVRELEEERKGRFIAFVDEDKDSHDVTITINPKTLKIKTTECDCYVDQDICVHIAAVAAKIVSGNLKSLQSTTVKKIKKRKLTEAEQFLESLEEQEVIEWLAAELHKNQLLFEKFKRKFDKGKEISAKEIEKQFELYLKAIKGRRKYLEKNEVGELIKILKPYYEECLEVLMERVTKDNMKGIIQIFKSLYTIHQKSKQYTSRIKTFKKKLLEHLKNRTSLLATEDKLRFLQINVENDEHILDYNLLAKLAIQTRDSMDTNQKIILYRYFLGLTRYLDYKKIDQAKYGLLELIDDAETFRAAASLITLVSYAPDYTLRILDMVTKYMNIEATIKNLEQLLDQSPIHHEELYIEKYGSLLKEVGRENELIDLYIKAFKKFRTRSSFESLIELGLDDDILLELKKEEFKIRSYPFANAFQEKTNLRFAMLDYFGEYDKMIALIKNYVSIWLSMEYTEKLIDHDRIGYLAALCKFSRTQSIGQNAMDLEDFIIDLLHQYFDKKSAQKLVHEVVKFRRNIELELHTMLGNI